MLEDLFGYFVANLTFDFVHLKDDVAILLQFVIVKSFAPFFFKLRQLKGKTWLNMFFY